MPRKTGYIGKARLGRDGKLRRAAPAGGSGGVLRGRVNAARLESPAAFAPDDDAPALTRRQLRELKPAAVAEVPDIASLRRRLRFSQGVFADLFGIPLGTLKDWESGRRRPDAPTRAYLRVIARDPQAVRRALEMATE